jgi:imidazole glycerol-phosphate synthase subunit HisH
MSREVAVVPTGTANTSSVLAALRRIGLDPVVTSDAESIAMTDRVVLPGVGRFGTAAGAIEGDVAESLRLRLSEDRSTLAVCVGLQLLAKSSEESPGIAGLGLVDSVVTRLGPGVRVPQMGWNHVQPGADVRLVRPGWAYFANSYRLTELPDGWAGATTEYDGPFVSAMERGNVLACQFHPELSGAWGYQLLDRWASLR